MTTQTKESITKEGSGKAEQMIVLSVQTQMRRRKITGCSKRVSANMRVTVVAEDYSDNAKSAGKENLFQLKQKPAIYPVT